MPVHYQVVCIVEEFRSIADHSMYTPPTGGTYKCHGRLECLPPKLIPLWYAQLNSRETLSRGVNPHRQPFSLVVQHLPALPSTEHHRPGRVHLILGTTLTPSGYLSCLANTPYVRVMRYRAPVLIELTPTNHLRM